MQEKCRDETRRARHDLELVFSAIAAIELGCFKQEDLDVSLELIYPVDKSYAALREGAVDFVGGSAHSALAAFPGLGGRQASVRASPRHVLVSGHARRTSAPSAAISAW
jgi:hypothetical protein